MAATAYTNTTNLYKRSLKDVVKGIKQNNTKTLNSFRRSGRKVKGGQNGYEIPFMTTRYAGNTAWSPANLSFRPSVPEESVSMFVGLAYGEKTIEINLPEWNDMKNNQVADSYAKRKMRGIADYMKHQNYYAIGDGTGALAYVASYSSGTLTGTVAATAAPGRTKGTIRLEKNNTYDVIDVATGTLKNRVLVTTTGNIACTVTLVPSGTAGTAPAAGDLICEVNHYNNVPRGLGYLISDVARTFQGVSTTAYPEFQNSAIDLAGSPLTPTTFNTLKGKVETRGNDDEYRTGFLAHLTPAQYRTLAAFGYGVAGAGRIYNAEKGGAQTTYGLPTEYRDDDTAFVVDADMDEDRVYLRRPMDFFEFVGMEFQTITVGTDSSGMRMQQGIYGVGSAAFYENLAEEHNFGYDGEDNNDAPNASALIKRAQVVSGSAQTDA